MKFEFNINITVQPSSEILKKLDDIQRSIRTIMADIHDVEADVALLTTVAESAEALLDGLSKQLKDALAANDPAAIQRVIDSIDANKKNLADAVTRNTPAATT